MHHSHNYQHFALDENQNIIDIHHTENAPEQRYYCPHCRKEMIAKRGSIRQWHFAHKSDKCSYDKYLHSIAEMMIMDWFNRQSSIALVMENPEKCSRYNDCAFRVDEYCMRTGQVCYDLKKYYSRCTKEHRYGDFVADLFCESDKNPNSPIFIEIFVTHECSTEKKSSGIRIIEFRIQSEEDILNIVNSSRIRESDTIRLYNFKQKETFTEEIELPFQKYILHPSLKSYVDNDRYTCKNYSKVRKGIYEISMPYDDCIPYFINSGGLYGIGKVKAYLDGYLKKDCQLCFWQSTDFMGDSFCKLYKKCGNPKYCKENDAMQCSMFRENRDTINLAVDDFNRYAENSPVDVWKLKKDVR